MNMHPFLSALLGGVLVGLSASLFLLANGRVAGISGIVGGLLERSERDTDWRVAFVLGLVVAGLVSALAFPGAFDAAPLRSVGVTAVAGLLVGFGSRMGNGCTSGHGICGLSRLSIRSLVAVMTFMATAGVTVFVSNHVIGVQP
jgi:uncharacterized membrane protein YedE/YeeE